MCLSTCHLEPVCVPALAGCKSKATSSASPSKNPPPELCEARLWTLLAKLLSSPYTSLAAIPTNIISVAAAAATTAAGLFGACVFAFKIFLLTLTLSHNCVTAQGQFMLCLARIR